MRRTIRQLLTYFISCIYRFTCTAPCTPSCQNGGLCVARDVCKCPAEYMGEQCQYPLCRPPCINGGDCVRPNVCMCPAAWKGNRCQMPVCHLPCLNGGKYVFLSKKNPQCALPGTHRSNVGHAQEIQFWTPTRQSPAQNFSGKM